MCKAVIMAGGEGKRLRPMTCTLPKPMVPLLNKPVIDYCIELLKKHGIEDITTTLHYLPSVITRHCGDGGRYGVRLSYSVEDAPLGTAGSVRKAAGGELERTVVISGDAITDADLTKAVRFHEERGAAATIVLKRVGVPTEYGVAMTDKQCRIYRFLEKPMLSEVFSDLANTGIYILEPEVIGRIPEGEKYDFSKDLFPSLLKEGLPVYGYVTEGYWCDIGDIAQYRAAQRDMLDGKVAFATAAKNKDGVWIEEGAAISGGAELLGPCYIGSGAEISEAVVSDHSVVGSGARIGRGSSLKRTVLMENARVRENSELRGAILCEGAEVESGASIYSGTVIGSGSRVGKNCTVCNGASLWPEKELHEDEDCTEDMQWEEDIPRPGIMSLIRGYCDRAMTPERAVRIGAAFARSSGRLPLEIAVSTDGSQQGVMLKHAAIAGLVSQGADAADMGFCGYSAFEHGIRAFGYRGGMYIRMGDDAHSGEIVLCDGSGTELTGNGFRAFRQELKAGAVRPITTERLGIVQRVSGAARSYDAHLSRLARSVRSGPNGVTALIGGSPEIYDAVARVLLPCGYSVRYYTGQDSDKLLEAAKAENADIAFMAVGMEGVTRAMAYGRNMTRHELNTALAMAAVREGRANKLTLPADMPEEYVKHIAQGGAEVSISPAKRSRWARAAIEAGVYLPELFEPEAKIIRAAELCLSGKLKEYLNGLPKVAIKEKKVPCSWRDMGRVLRSFTEGEDDDKVQLVDGVKVNVDKGWVLVRPDSGFTAYRVIAGSFDAEYSKELTDVYAGKLRAIAENKEG